MVDRHQPAGADHLCLQRGPAGQLWVPVCQRASNPERGLTTVPATVTRASMARAAAGSAPPVVRLIEGIIPGAENAIIDMRKLTEYALNLGHPVGGSKARVFDSALGFGVHNADELAAQIRLGVTQNPGMAGRIDQYGRRFTVDVPVTGPRGSGIVRTGCIYRPSSQIPELTTLYVR